MELWSADSRLCIEKRRALYLPQTGDARVRKEYGQVVMIIDDKRLEMSTPVAVKVGLELVKSAGTAVDGELVALTISGVEVLLLPDTATRIGGAILRKADKADDWQRANNTPSRRLQ